VCVVQVRAVRGKGIQRVHVVCGRDDVQVPERVLLAVFVMMWTAEKGEKGPGRLLLQLGW